MVTSTSSLRTYGKSGVRSGYDSHGNSVQDRGFRAENNTFGTLRKCGITCDKQEFTDSGGTNHTADVR
jgi:hypothetical protein